MIACRTRRNSIVLLREALPSVLSALLLAAAPPAFLPAQTPSRAGSPYGPAVDQPGLVIPAIRTRAEILPRLEALKKLPVVPAFSVAPSCRKPFNAGVLAADFVRLGLSWLNFYRFLAGMPDDVVVNPEWGTLAQHAAVLLSVQGVLSHAPPYPSGIGMPREFYDKAFEGASTSNLHQGQDNLGDAVSGWVFDSDEGNIDRVGHRRWVLSPGLREVGFGYAEGFTALKVFSRNGSLGRSEFAYMAWPPAGEIPLSAFPLDAAWSFSIDPAAFGGQLRGSVDSIRVELTRERDGKAWKLGADQRAGFFNVEKTGFSLPFCVIFRPAGLGSLMDNDVFDVRILGLTADGGREVPVHYKAGFFNPGPRITVKAVTKKPRVPTVDFTWETREWGRKSGSTTDGSMNFGFVGVPLKGFSFTIDTPEGVLPIGVEINESGNVIGPGEWVQAPADGIVWLKIVSASSGGQIRYTVFRKARGWSQWASAGEKAGFAANEPIEIINVSFR